MMKNTRVIAIAAQKGGVGKTATAINLGAALTQAGRSVLLIDCDINPSMTKRLGILYPDTLEHTIATIMAKSMQDIPFEENEAIIQHAEGFDFVPSNARMADINTALAGVMSREQVLRNYTETLRGKYDYILLDCLPGLELFAINALAAADEAILLTTPDFDSAKSLDAVMQTIATVKKKRINEGLQISGLLFTMVNHNTKDAKQTISQIGENYGSHLHIYESRIPYSVRAKEPGKHGKSIFSHTPKSAVAFSYAALAKEVDS